MSQLCSLTPDQRNAFLAAYPGWLASANANVQTGVAERHGGAKHPGYALGLASVILVVLLAVAAVSALGREARNVEFAAPDG